MLEEIFEKCFEKLEFEIINTLLSITNNAVQQKAIKNKICSMITDLYNETKNDNLKNAHSRFVRDVSSVVEGMLLPEITERNVKRLCKNDAYKFLATIEKLTLEKDN